MTARENRLKELRTRAYLTQQEVANFFGVTIAVVSRHENGTRGLSHDAILRYARLYKVFSYEIFFTAPGSKHEWEDEDPPPVEEESSFAT